MPRSLAARSGDLKQRFPAAQENKGCPTLAEVVKDCNKQLPL